MPQIYHIYVIKAWKIHTVNMDICPERTLFSLETNVKDQMEKKSFVTIKVLFFDPHPNITIYIKVRRNQLSFSTYKT